MFTPTPRYQYVESLVNDGIDDKMLISCTMENLQRLDILHIRISEWGRGYCVQSPLNSSPQSPPFARGYIRRLSSKSGVLPYNYNMQPGIRAMFPRVEAILSFGSSLTPR
jgi:hypothetical protein